MTDNNMSKSTASLAVGNVVAVLSGFVALMISARILSPADFGVFGIAMIIIMIPESVISGQFHRVLIQRSEVSKQHISTMLSLSTLLGIVATTLIIVLNPVLGNVFNEPRLNDILPTMSLLLLIMGASSTAASIMLREMRFQKVALIDITSSIIAAIVAVIIVIKFQSIWSLVCMEVSRRLVRLFMFVAYSRMHFDFRYFHVAALEMYDYSKKAVMTGALTTVERVLPGIFIGYSLGPAAVGLYNMAFRLLEQALTVLVNPISSVSFPVFAKAQGDMTLVRLQLQKAVSLATLTAAPAFGGGIVAAPTLVPLLFGGQWSAAIPLVQLSFMTGMVLAIAGINYALIEGIGYPGKALKVIAATTIATFIGVISVLNISLEAVLLVIFAKTILMWFMTIYQVKRLAGQPYVQQIMPMAVPFLATFIMMSVTQAFYTIWGGDMPKIMSLMLTVCIGVIIYPVALFVIKPKLFFMALEQVGARFFSKM